MSSFADAPPTEAPKPQAAEGAAPEGEIDVETNWDETTETFDAMELRDDLLRGIYAYGFEQPSAIQKRAIKPMLMKRDVIAQAQSGKKDIHPIPTQTLLCPPPALFPPRTPVRIRPLCIYLSTPPGSCVVLLAVMLLLCAEKATLPTYIAHGVLHLLTCQMPIKSAF